MAELNTNSGDKGRASPLVSFSTGVNKVCEVILFVLMLAMIVTTTAQVLCRMFTQALTWSEELTRFLLVTVSLVGAAVAFYRGSHIAVTFLVEKLPGALRAVLFLVMQLAGVCFFVILARYGWVLMEQEASQMTPALGLSMKLLYGQFPVFSAVVILHLLAGIELYLRGGQR